MDPVRSFRELIAKHGHDHFGKVRLSEFSLHVIGEADVSFLLGNCGETVGQGDPINERFMLIKEHLGFEQVDRGEFTKSVSKFSSDLEIGCLKLVVLKSWIVRVIDETTDHYLALTTKASPPGAAWQAYPGTNFFVAWIRKSETVERI